MTFVNKCTRLGHIIAANLNDKSDIIFCKNSFSGKANNALCYFASCAPAIKFQPM